MTRILMSLLLAIAAGTQVVAAQELSVPVPARSDRTALESVVPELARRALAQFSVLNTQARREDRFVLELATGEYTKAAAIAGTKGFAETSQRISLQIYAEAKSHERRWHEAFAPAFRREFRAAFARLDDLTAIDAAWALETRPAVFQNSLEQSLDQHRGSSSLSLTDVITLATAYDSARAYADFGSLVESLVSADDNRRYIIDTNVLIHAQDGATLSAIVVRNRQQTAAGPTALFATVQTDTRWELRNAKYAAAHGYVGMSSDTRGKRLSPDEIVLYEDDASDLYGVIDWISHQPWSNGKVGMWGGSASGFEQWAAAKTLHPALKTIVPYCPENPGYGLPMQNNVFITANYPVSFYLTDNKYLDNSLYDDTTRWQSLIWKWYRSGRPFREIDQIDGKPNPWLQRWLKHPAYDAYWQSMTAYENDFSRLNIPVLAIDGYYDDGQNFALLNLQEHYRHDAHAEHYLLIGPYDHFGTQGSFKPPVLRGYAIDPVAQIDTPAITFQWFDYILRGAPKPALLQDRINYEVMGANVWRHAPSLEQTHDDVLTLYLSDAKDGGDHALTAEKPERAGGLAQTVNFTDRSTVSSPTYPGEILFSKLDRPSGFTFISKPFVAPVAVTGMFSADLKLITNKKDLDIALVLYEITPQGQYFHLAYTVQRASFAEDMTVRHLLEPGKAQTIPIRQTLFVSRQLMPGSRLLVVLDVNKGPWGQVNYGTGGDVSDESITDAQVPLRVEWRNDSVVRIPISR